jgi:hypothetical protein
VTSSVTTIESVAVRFRLYNKLGAGGKAGDYKSQPGVPPEKRLWEPFWVYLFLDDLSSVQLTHEIFVDPSETYHYFADLFKGQPNPPSQPGIDSSKCAVLAIAHSTIDHRRLCPYYALYSPFRLPKSRLDYIVPQGRAENRDQFLSWADDRQLEMLLFSSAERKSGVLRESWAPWLRATALADEYYAAMDHYGRAYLDKTEIAQIAGLVESFEHSIPLDDYISRANLKAFKMTRPELDTACATAAKNVADFVASQPFQEMTLDMWEDKTELGHLILTPYLAHCYKTIPVKRLLDAEAIDERFFSRQFDNSVTRTKLGRRFLKAILDLNGTFAKALVFSNEGTYTKAVVQFANWAGWWTRVFLRLELKRDSSTGWFDVPTIQKIQNMKGTVVHAMIAANVFEGFNLAVAVVGLTRNPTSRNGIALIGATSSYVSSVLKVIQAQVGNPDAKTLKRTERAIDEIGRRIGPLSEGEERLLAGWIERKRTLKMAGVVGNQGLNRTLGMVSGLSDALGAVLDAWKAVGVGDREAAVGYGIIVIGGALLVASAFAPTSLFWLAGMGQLSELAGLLLASTTESSDVGLWLRFCYFGQRNWDKENSSTRWWTGKYTLGQIAASPSKQLLAFSNIVYQMDIEAKLIVYRIQGRDDPKLDITVRFPYGYPNGAQLYLRISVLREDGRVGVPQSLKPWPEVRHVASAGKSSLPAVSGLFDPSAVLLGSTFMFVHAWLDVTGSGDFYPDSGPLTKTIKIKDIPEVRAY